LPLLGAAAADAIGMKRRGHLSGQDQLRENNPMHILVCRQAD
jgi:hypothetical protein